LLLERGFVSSRAKAQAMILAGQVRVDGALVTKVGQQVSLEKRIDLISGPRYVSRGGDKLAGALIDCNVSPKGRVCLDVGSSTGGFTDCLLQNGAVKVYAVDVGRAQLADALKKDTRVVSMEELHIRDLAVERLDPVPTFCTIDVSFISLTQVLPSVKALLPPNSAVLAMVKPQFEVGAKFLRKGVVVSDEIRAQAVETVAEFAKREGFYYHGQALSHLKGPKGNQEIFLHMTT
jgi:23S rRNA (cytidine1920-2'-O)/16S rRNA (cytidine1409-2'-O)-methyltransferase